MDNNTLRQLKIDEQLCSAEVASLKFLCSDVLGRKCLETVSDALDLFERLNEQGLLEDDMLFLQELLLTIKRHDLLKFMNTTEREVSRNIKKRGDSYQGLSAFRKMLYDIADDMTSEKLVSFKFLLNLPRGKLEASATTFDVLTEMEKQQRLTEENVEDLEQILNECDKQLAKKVEGYRLKERGPTIARSKDSFSLPKKQQSSTEVEKLEDSEKCVMAADEKQPEGREERRESEQVDGHEKTKSLPKKQQPEGEEERGEPEEVDGHENTLDKTLSEVHLNPPVWRCESCAHTTDADLWNVREPTISKETGAVVYTHQSPPGSHECAVSGFRWVCSEEVIFQYHLADPDKFKVELAALGYTPIGPFMDISVLLGEMDEAHLPHFACVDRSDSTFSDAVRVLRGVDSGPPVLEECARLTCRHAKLHHPIFSVVGLLVKKDFPLWTLLDVLVYRTRAVPLTLFIYVVPREKCMIQEVEAEAERIGGKRIHKHRPNASIWMNTNLTLVSDMAEISPDEITLKYVTPPDLFEVFVENAVESIGLELFAAGQSIWKVTLRHADYCEDTGVAGSPASASPASDLTPPIGSRRSQQRSGAASHMGGRGEIASVSYRGMKERLFQVQLELISRGSQSLLKKMLDILQSQKPPVVSKWEADDVLHRSSVPQDQWRSLLTTLHNKGDAACGIMLQVLRDLDYYLYKDLGL